MKHTKRQTRRSTTRRSTTRRSTTRRSRRTRGGNKIDPNHVASCKNVNRFKGPTKNGKIDFIWPDDAAFPDGCDPNKPMIPVEVKKDDKFDRFGGIYGKFGSPLNDKTYSYASRALPYTRLENNSHTLCNNVYEAETIRDSSYHVYKVIADDGIPGVTQCNSLKYFNKPGDAVQWKFKENIKTMLENNLIEEIPFDSLPNFV
jgi:hypothetical protein